jgi:hypothetical protein
MTLYIRYERRGDRPFAAQFAMDYRQERRRHANMDRTYTGVYRTIKLTDGLIGSWHPVEVALIVAQTARRNRHSCGCHYRQDSLQG